VTSQYWNHNKQLNLAFPSGDQVVTEAQLQKEPKLIKLFDPAGPIRSLAEAAILANVQPFTDVEKTHWAHDKILTLRQQQIVAGYENNEFRPNRSITRAEFVAMTIHALGLEPETAPLSFKDKDQIPGWANQAIQTAVKAGLIHGYEDGTVRPNQEISRAEMAAILASGLKLSAPNDYPLNYKDIQAIPGWAVDPIKAATANGLFNGRDDGSFAPNDNAIRAEVAAVLYQAIMR
jgi:hypothetical protein